MVTTQLQVTKTSPKIADPKIHQNGTRFGGGNIAFLGEHKCVSMVHGQFAVADGKSGAVQMYPNCVPAPALLVSPICSLPACLPGAESWYGPISIPLCSLHTAGAPFVLPARTALPPMTLFLDRRAAWVPTPRFHPYCVLPISHNDSAF